MALPLRPPVLPQLAKSQKTLPEGEGWVYEPKWDGFRSIAFVDGGRSTCSRATASRSRATSRSSRSRRGATSSTVRSCCSTSAAARTSTRSASASTRRSRGSTCWPRRRRRASSPSTCSRSTTRRCSSCPSASAATRLEGLIAAPVDLTPASEDPAEAQPWLQHAEGVIAKRQEAPYRPGERVGHGEDQAPADDRRGRAGLAAGQGGGHRRLPQPRALHAGRAPAQRRPHLRLHREAEARAARLPRPV